MSGQIRNGSAFMEIVRIDLYEVSKITLVWRVIFRQPATVLEQLCNNVGEDHISSYQYEQHLIHRWIDPDRTSLAGTRYNNHSVVTIYKYY